MPKQEEMEEGRTFGWCGTRPRLRAITLCCQPKFHDDHELRTLCSENDSLIKYTFHNTLLLVIYSKNRFLWG